MSTPAEEKLKVLISANNNDDDHFEAIDKYRNWFLQQFDKSSTCSLEIFAVYFLNAIRQSTELHLRTIDVVDTTKCQTPNRTNDNSRNTSLIRERKQLPDFQHSTPEHFSTPTPGLLILKNTTLDDSGTYTPVKSHSVTSINDTPITSINTSKLKASNSAHCISLERSSFTDIQQNHTSNTSTPVRRPQQHQQRRTNNSHSSYANASHSTEKLTRSSGASSGFCLGDFLVANSPTIHNRSSGKKKAHQTTASTATAATAVTTNQQAEKSPSVGKPKKRVVPTTISTRTTVNSNNSSPFGIGNSSFGNENNILKISNSEIIDKNQCAVMEARKALKMNPCEISKELQSTKDLCAINERQNLPKTDELINSVSNEIETQFSLDFSDISKSKILKKLAKIYSLLIDLNFTTNILSELSFLLNLLNAKYQPQTPTQETTTDVVVEKIKNLQLTNDKVEEVQEQQLEVFKIFGDLRNSIYFATQVLELQRTILLLLDLKSISVILDNERIQILSLDLKQELQNVYQLKQQNSAPTTLRFDKIFKNVYFQDDEDSRENFNSNSEFGAFKTQRDLFYKLLQIWETNHLKPTWNFTYEITPKLREIFKQSENPNNMAHFAKLFVSQLLISASDATSPEEIGLDTADMQKISKLTQRLITPSNFSVDYQFPRSQGFFRDFISEARSIAFMVQLKMALYSQLITLNDSHFEHLSFDISGRDDEDSDETATNAQNEYIVRAEVLSTMLILAKFLGFVTAQPFNAGMNNNSVYMSSSLEKKQLNLRSLFQPNFDVCRILQLSIKNGKLLITLPWLVQYFALLDNVTLQLECYAKTTQVLCALYMHLGMNNLTFSATAKFIICCCIGWLFETKSILAEQYYNYRSNRTTLLNKTIEELNELNDTKQITTINSTTTTNISSNTTTTSTFILNRMLESTLNVACPFLAAFRVTIMPAKYQTVKYASRTGRYRYITTRITDTSTTQNKSNDISYNSNINDTINTNALALEQQDTEEMEQKKLIEAFLHSQNASMRRLIEFVIERTYKSVVKDAQNEILLPSKSAADNEVNKITSIDANEVQKSVRKIYDDAMNVALQKWDTKIDIMINERIEKALDALLPFETMEILKRTYHFLIYQSAKIKIHDWRLCHVDKANFYYSSDLDDMTDKICKSNRKKNEQIPIEISSTELKLVENSPSVSKLIDDMQLLLHCTTLRMDLLTDDRPIFTFLQRIPTVFVNILPTTFYRLVGSGIVQLFQNLIIRLPHWITQALIDAACNVWIRPEMIKFAYRYPLKAPLMTPEKIEEKIEIEEGEMTKEQLNINFDVIPGIFDGLIKISFIQLIKTQRICYEKLKDLIVALIQKNVISVDYVNELFVPIFKEDWPTQILNEISLMLRVIAQETAGCRSGGGVGAAVGRNNIVNVNDDNDVDVNDDEDDVDDNGKAHLFMEVLSDFARDVDEF